MRGLLLEVANWRRFKKTDLAELLEILDLMESSGKKLNRDYLWIKSMDVFCMVGSDNGQGGACLKAVDLARLAKLEIDLKFHFYG